MWAINLIRAGLIAGLAAFPAAAEDGASLYADHCAVCHQAGGDGVPYMQPSLIASPRLSGDADDLIAFLLYAEGSGEGDWANVMPQFDYLTDEEAAAILTYTREEFAGAGQVNQQYESHHSPTFSIDAQGSRGGSASPFCKSSMEIPSGDRTNAIWPSRGGRLMVTPWSESFWHALYISSTR